MDLIRPPPPAGVGFYKSLIAAGATLATGGLLILLFQAAMALVVGDLHVFSAFGLLQRLRLDHALDTGVVGFDQTLDWVLRLPLGIFLAAIGIVIGCLGAGALQQEKLWHRLK